MATNININAAETQPSLLDIPRKVGKGLKTVAGGVSQGLKTIGKETKQFAKLAADPAERNKHHSDFNETVDKTAKSAAVTVYEAYADKAQKIVDTLKNAENTLFKKEVSFIRNFSISQKEIPADASKAGKALITARNALAKYHTVTAQKGHTSARLFGSYVHGIVFATLYVLGALTFGLSFTKSGEIIEHSIALACGATAYAVAQIAAGAVFVLPELAIATGLVFGAKAVAIGSIGAFGLVATLKGAGIAAGVLAGLAYLARNEYKHHKHEKRIDEATNENKRLHETHSQEIADLKEQHRRDIDDLKKQLLNGETVALVKNEEVPEDTGLEEMQTGVNKDLFNDVIAELNARPRVLNGDEISSSSSDNSSDTSETASESDQVSVASSDNISDTLSVVGDEEVEESKIDHESSVTISKEFRNKIEQLYAEEVEETGISTYAKVATTALISFGTIAFAGFFPEVAETALNFVATSI